MTVYLDALRNMDYPGRIILIGGLRAGRAAVVYAITGRSPASQARRLHLDGRSVWTEPLDAEVLKGGDPNLLTYRALAVDAAVAVSNGRQTDDVAAVLGRAGRDEDPAAVLERALVEWTYEPDAPHYTPRISGCVMASGRAGLSLIRRAPDGEPERTTASWTLEPGRARFVATYEGREANPLPPFPGGPREIEMSADGTAGELAEAVSDALAPAGRAHDYRVSVACLCAPLAAPAEFEIHIINHRERQGPHGKDR